MVLGGSRAIGTHRDDSDWDLGLYYRGTLPIEPEELRGLGYEGRVSELGEWGPIVNGGAWLTVDGAPVDVLFRDLDVIERWLEQARQGRFDVLTQNGYIVGAPTYLPAGELALCRHLVGSLPRPSFPAALASTAARRWRGRAEVSLMFALGHARTGDAVCCAGMLAGATLCTAHARVAARHEWALNEKTLVRRAGLEAAQSLLARPGSTSEELVATVRALAANLSTEPLTAR